MADIITIGGVQMPLTRTLEVGGENVVKETQMSDGTFVRDIIGFRPGYTATWEWLPQETVIQVSQIARAGGFVDCSFPDPVAGLMTGKYKISIGNQKVFRYRNGEPYWYNVELTAAAQEVINGSS